MTAIKDYPKEFVERTLELLEKVYPSAKTHELEVTFLLNCLLGLIIATYEKLDSCKEGFFNKRLVDDEVFEFVPHNIARIDIGQLHKDFKAEINGKSLIAQHGDSISINQRIEVQKFKLVKNITLREFIRNIRNGIAHQNLMATSQDHHWHGIRIWNHDKNGIKDFEVEFEINHLMKFAKFIGSKFIEYIPVKSSP